MSLVATKIDLEIMVKQELPKIDLEDRCRQNQTWKNPAAHGFLADSHLQYVAIPDMISLLRPSKIGQAAMQTE